MRKGVDGEGGGTEGMGWEGRVSGERNEEVMVKGGVMERVG